MLRSSTDHRWIASVAAWFLIVTVVSAALFVPSEAAAQAGDQQGFRAANFDPTISQHSGVLNLNRPAVLPHGTPSVGLFTDYSHNPLDFPQLDVASPPGIYLTRALTSQVGAAVGLFDVIEVSVSAPVMSVQWGRLPNEEQGAFPYGDVRGGVDVLLVDPEWANGFGISASGAVRVPTGQTEEFTSDGEIRVDPRLSFGKQFAGGHEIILNTGMAIGNPVSVPKFGYTDIGMLKAGLGGIIHVPNTELDVIASLFGNGSLQATTIGPDGEEISNTARAIEALGGMRVDLPANLRLQAGGGAGINNGLPAPDYRVFTSIHWTTGIEEQRPEPKPDQRPRVAEADEEETEQEASEETETKVAKAEESSPDRSETADDQSGQTEEASEEEELASRDSKTSTSETADRDPEQPEAEPESDTRDKKEDIDQDGIAAGSDQCPDAPEDKDGYQDGDGCPDEDNDGDALADADDECPDQAETDNGFKDDDGCRDADEYRKALAGAKEKIEEQQVQFGKGSGQISSEARAQLKTVADLLNKFSAISTIRIEGHTDSKGPESLNDRLSSERAESAKRFLVRQGIAEDRLETKAFGEQQPTASNETQDGRQKNRRVEFVVAETD